MLWNISANNERVAKWRKSIRQIWVDRPRGRGGPWNDECYNERMYFISIAEHFVECVPRQNIHFIWFVCQIYAVKYVRPNEWTLNQLWETSENMEIYVAHVKGMESIFIGLCVAANWTNWYGVHIISRSCRISQWFNKQLYTIMKWIIYYRHITRSNYVKGVNIA